MKVRFIRLPGGGYHRVIEYRGVQYATIHDTRADSRAGLGERLRTMAEVVNRGLPTAKQAAAALAGVALGAGAEAGAERIARRFRGRLW